MSFLESLNHRFWRVPRRISSYFQVKLHLSHFSGEKFCFKHIQENLKYSLEYITNTSRRYYNFLSAKFQILSISHICSKFLPTISQGCYYPILKTRTWVPGSLSNLLVQTRESGPEFIPTTVCFQGWNSSHHIPLTDIH